MKGLNAFFPVGIDPKEELMWVCCGWGGSFLCSIGFFVALGNARNGLFVYRGGVSIAVLREGAVMPDFGALLGGWLAGFLVVAFCMLGLAAYHYAYHFVDSKSIYLMRRLPQRWEFLRRCAAAPLLCALLSLLLGLALLLLYYGFYLFVTPAGCLAEGQWARFFANLIGG